MDLYEKIQKVASNQNNFLGEWDWLELDVQDIAQYWHSFSSVPRVFIRASVSDYIELVWISGDDYSLECVESSDYDTIYELLENELFDDSWASQKVSVVRLSDFEEGA